MRVCPTRLWLAVATAAITGAGARPATATRPPVPLASCVADAGNAPAAFPTPVALAVRPVAQVRHLEKANVTVSVGSTAEGALQVDATAGDLSFRKTVQANGRSTLELETPRDKVAIELTEAGISVTIGGETIALSSQTPEHRLAEVRSMLAASRAINRLRAVGAKLEASGDDSALSAALLLSDSLVGVLTGDVGAPGRVGRLLSQRARAGLRRVQSGRPDNCYYQWERNVLFAYMDWEECLFLWEWWFGWCTGRWYMQVETAWFSLIGCIGLGV